MLLGMLGRNRIGDHGSSPKISVTKATHNELGEHTYHPPKFPHVPLKSSTLSLSFSRGTH